MGAIGFLQTSSVYIIIGVFLFIAGKELYSRLKEQNEIRAIRHKKLIEKISKEEIVE